MQRHVAVHVRRAGRRAVAANHVLRLRRDLIAQPEIERIGVTMRGRLGNAENQQACCGQKALQRPVFSHQLCKLTLYKSVHVSDQLPSRECILPAMMNVEKYKERLRKLEKQLDSRTSRDLENGRENLIDTAHDSGDASVSDVAVDSEFTEAELNSAILQQVQDALRRIDSGTYGKCAVDGQPIEAKRLEAVPWAAYCVKHQALLEAAGSDRHWTL